MMMMKHRSRTWAWDKFLPSTYNTTMTHIAGWDDQGSWKYIWDCTLNRHSSFTKACLCGWRLIRYCICVGLAVATTANPPFNTRSGRFNTILTCSLRMLATIHHYGCSCHDVFRRWDACFI